jgi:hypothetical protein
MQMAGEAPTVLVGVRVKAYNAFIRIITSLNSIDNLRGFI